MAGCRITQALKAGPWFRELGVDGPFWGRQYVFWHGGKPLTVIYEVFSPRLQEYLGPISG